MRKKTKKKNVFIASIIIVLLLITLFGITIGFDKENIRLLENTNPNCLFLNFNDQIKSNITATIRLANKSINKEFEDILMKDFENIKSKKLINLKIHRIPNNVNGVTLFLDYKNGTSIIGKKLILGNTRKILKNNWYAENVKFCGYSYDD